MSLELRGGWSPKNAEGVQGQSWQNSKTALEWKTGHPLTILTSDSTSFFRFQPPHSSNPNHLILQILTTSFSRSQPPHSPDPDHLILQIPTTCFRNALEFFLLQAPSINPQYYHMLLPPQHPHLTPPKAAPRPLPPPKVTQRSLLTLHPLIQTLL